MSSGQGDLRASRLLRRAIPEPIPGSRPDACWSSRAEAGPRQGRRCRTRTGAATGSCRYGRCGTPPSRCSATGSGARRSGAAAAFRWPAGRPGPARSGRPGQSWPGRSAASRAQHPGRLRDPGVRITRDARTVFGNHQVESGIGQRYLLSTGMDQREAQPEAILQPGSGGQLRSGVVQADGPGAAAGQPG